MVAPTDYAITIKVNSVDVTSFVPYDSITFDDYVHTVSSFNFTIENPSGVTPTKNHTVVVTANTLAGTPVIFDGYIKELETKKRDNGITTKYDVEAADKKIRLLQSVLDVDTLTGTDASILDSLLSSSYPDLSSEFDFSSEVDSLLADITLPTANKSILDAIEELSDLTGDSDWRVDNVGGGTSTVTRTLTFTGVEFIPVDLYDGITADNDYSEFFSYFPTSAAVAGTDITEYPALDASAGNPTDCIRWTPNTGTWHTGTGELLEFYHNAYSDTDGVVPLTSFTFDYYVHSDISASVKIQVLLYDDNYGGYLRYEIASPAGSAWTSVDVNTDFTQIAGDTTAISDVEIRTSVINHIIIRFIPTADIAAASNTIDIRLDNIALVDAGVSGFMDFDGTTGDAYTDGNYAFNGTDWSTGVATVGSSGDAWQAGIGGFATNKSASDTVNVLFDFGGSSKTINNFVFDLYVADALRDNITIQLVYGATPTVADSFAGNADVPPDEWSTWDWQADIGDDPFPITSDKFGIQFLVTGAITGADIDLRLDGMTWDELYTSPNSTPTLIWGDTPDSTDFNIDIGSGDEFAFDINLSVGDIDDFNSVTVIGGVEDDAIDWTYESDGDQEHFDLELPVKDIVVYKNTGTDGSPTWTEQTVGTWGDDDLTGDGGSADVLYDPKYNWLLFNSNPSNLSKSIRVTGSIEKPIRIRVENIESGDPVFATTVYNDKITSVEEAVAVGNAALQKNNSIRRLDFKTYEPGLKVGQSIGVTDSARGLDETLVISRISTRWLGSSGHAQFEIQCGDDDYTGADTLIANNDKRSRDNVPNAGVTTPTYSPLTDSSGNVLTDSSGNILYESS